MKRVKPGDHPQFFQFPAPEGRSRESSIVLDAQGCFWHEGEKVTHPRLSSAMHAWIDTNPDNGRPILSNGYDWTYFTAADTPYYVVRVELNPDEGILHLSDGQCEPWVVADTIVRPDGSLLTRVKRDKPRGPWTAAFTRNAQLSLVDILGDEGGVPTVFIGSTVTKLGGNGPFPSPVP